MVLATQAAKMEILGKCVTQGNAMTTTVLFQDDFSTNGPLNSANWDFNRWEQKNNPSYLGLTQMRQSLPVAENGMARIRLDTWLDGKAFSGSEAITPVADRFLLSAFNNLIPLFAFVQ